MAAYTVDLTAAARRGMRRLPVRVLERVGAAVNALADDPRPPGLAPLAGHRGLLRVRVGVYRVVYEIDDDRALVSVIRVGHRREVYRNL